jgi:hypothetical protein
MGNEEKRALQGSSTAAGKGEYREFVLQRLIIPGRDVKKGVPGALYLWDPKRGIAEYVCDSWEHAEKDTPAGIPVGDYPLTLSLSSHLVKTRAADPYRPLLANVPGRSGIQIHNGNSMAHSLGCILVGTMRPTLSSFVSGTTGPQFERVKQLMRDYTVGRIHITEVNVPRELAEAYV